MARPRTKRAAVAPEPLPEGVADFTAHKIRRMAQDADQLMQRVRDADREVERLRYWREQEELARRRLAYQLDIPYRLALHAKRTQLSEAEVKALGVKLDALRDAYRAGVSMPGSIVRADAEMRPDAG